MSGSPRVLCDLVKNFPKQGRKMLLTSGNNGFLSEKDVESFIKIPYVLVSNKYLKLFLYTINQILVFHVLSFLLLSMRVKNEQSTVIINTLLPFGAAFAAKIFANKTIYYIHETSIKPIYLHNILTKFVYLTANEIIFVTEYVRSFYQILSDNLNCHVVYNPLRSDFIYKLDNEKINFCERYVLFVGTLKEYKGIYNLLELARITPSKKFVAVVNAELEEFDCFMAEQDIPNNIIFKRRPGNLDEIYRQALFTLNLSLPHLWVETFGLTLLESMHFSVPVIAPDYGGPKEIVNAKVGFLIEPSDLNKIRSIILSTEESSWNFMSNNSSKHSKNFSLEKYIQQISKVI